MPPASPTGPARSGSPPAVGLPPAHRPPPLHHPSTTEAAQHHRGQVEEHHRADRPKPTRWSRHAGPDSMVHGELLRGLGHVGRRHRATTSLDWSCGRHASRRGELEVRAHGWGCRSIAGAAQASHNHAGTLRRLAGSAHLFGQVTQSYTPCEYELLPLSTGVLFLLRAHAGHPPGIGMGFMTAQSSH